MGVWFLVENPLTTCKISGILWVDTIIIYVYCKDKLVPKHFTSTAV